MGAARTAEVTPCGVAPGGDGDVTSGHGPRVANGHTSGGRSLRKVLKYGRQPTGEVRVRLNGILESQFEPPLAPCIVRLSFEVLKRALPPMAGEAIPDKSVETVQTLVDRLVHGPSGQTGGLAGQVADEGADGERCDSARIHG